jgi:hypothetical protein
MNGMEGSMQEPENSPISIAVRELQPLKTKYRVRCDICGFLISVGQRALRYRVPLALWAGGGGGGFGALRQESGFLHPACVEAFPHLDGRVSFCKHRGA